MPIERDGLGDAFAWIVVSVERHRRGGTEPLTCLRIVLKTVRRRRVGDREVISIAGAHTDRTVRAPHRLRLFLRADDDTAAVIVVAADAEQTVEKAALLALQGGRAILRPAIVLSERNQRS